MEESGCSEDPDVKGTETRPSLTVHARCAGCSEDPDVKGTETECQTKQQTFAKRCSEDPDVKGTETPHSASTAFRPVRLQRGSRCKGN